jgi:hypothetical protein
MIFKKKDNIPMKFGLMLGMKVCVAKFNVKKNRDEAKVGYIIARRQYFTLRSEPYEEGGMYWKYLVKFSDGSTEEYKEEEIYLDYDRRLEDGNN